MLDRYLQPLREANKGMGLYDTFSTGSGTYGVGGNSTADTTFYAKIKQTKIGNITLKDKILEFRKKVILLETNF